MKRLDPMEEQAALRTLELMTPLSVFIVEESAGDHLDRLAVRVALTLLLEHVTHPDDDSAAKRIECVIREGLAT